MSARYADLGAHLAPGTRRVEISFRIANASSRRWRSSDGDAIGWHLFDAENGTVIVDGPRALPSPEIAPGDSAPWKAAVDLPEEDGSYEIFVSPMREGECWFYERGWPFVLVEATVRGGAARIETARLATLAQLRRRRALRALGRAFVYPVAAAWRNRGLIRVMVRRDVLGRYRGSFGGAFWTVINPLLLMLTYFFVFGMVLRARFGADPSRSGFALYFLAGMLPWLAFSEAAGRAPTVLLDHRNFVKKLVFPVETLPLNLVVAGLISEAFAVILYILALWGARGAVPASALWLPVLVLPQVLFTAGIAWFLAALGVFVRDLGQIIGFLMTLWFFLTPICYPETSLPPEALPLLSKNPMFVLVRGYRDIFLEGHAPAWGAIGKLWVVSAAAFVLGHAWFYKLRKSFADMI